MLDLAYGLTETCAQPDTPYLLFRSLLCTSGCVCGGQRCRAWLRTALSLSKYAKVKSDTLARRCGAGRGWAARSLRPRSWTASACGYPAPRGILRWTAMCPSRTEARSAWLEACSRSCTVSVCAPRRPSGTDQAAGTLLIGQGLDGPSWLRAAVLLCCWCPGVVSRGAVLRQWPLLCMCSVEMLILCLLCRVQVRCAVIE